MWLGELLKDVNVVSINENLMTTEVADIKIDHRSVKKGDVFIALKGVSHNGNDFAGEAINNGASCVISEDKLPFKNSVQVENARSAYAIMSKHYFSDACDNLRMIAITGTNGKTTTANSIASLLKTAGAKARMIGTLGASFNGKNIETGFTTPDPYILHKILNKMAGEGAEFVVMEVSAHALALSKVDGIKFEIGVLTNITEDHLDFFEDMDCYAKTKFKLFEQGRIKLGIICGGKEYSVQAAENAQVPIITYGIDGDYDVCAKNVNMTFQNSHFVCDYIGEKSEIDMPLVGAYNVENALASIAVCRSLGIDKKLIQLGMNCLPTVEGRFNVINISGRNIVIDFAHTPDGLEKVLKTAKELTGDKIVVVFGCGGNRDRFKRPIMGHIAEKYADFIVLTSDNPRFENPKEIIKEIGQGIKGDYICEEDRKKAIEWTLSNFCNNETIIIAGKGGEKYQDINGIKYPYNDFDVVYNYFRKNIKPINNLQKTNANIIKNKENNDFCEENEIK